jgi:hypothetical protein
VQGFFNYVPRPEIAIHEDYSFSLKVQDVQKIKREEENTNSSTYGN